MQTAAISWVVGAPVVQPQEALSKILRGRSVYGVDQPAQAGMVKLNTGLLSVPDSTAGSPSILEVSAPGESSILLGFEQRMLRTPEEFREINGQIGEPKYYVDPSLRSARRYSVFIRRLHRAGLVSFSLKASAHIGFFAVLKKDGRHRLILDCRPVNRLFRAPPGVDLLTGEGFARVEVAADEDEAMRASIEKLLLVLGVADVSDCFHRLRFGSHPVMEKLKRFFAYPAVRAGDVKVTSIGGVAISADTMIFPLAESLPMGWSWSLFFAQSANSFQLGRSMSDIGPVHVMSDRGAPLVFRPAQSNRVLGSYVYVDNLGLLSNDGDAVRRQISASTKHFDKLGLVIHEVEINDVVGKALGVQVALSERATRTEPTRWWTLRVAPLAILQRSRVSGVELELVLGHATFCGLMAREVLSCLHAVYRFVQNHYWERAELWQSVREEMEGFLGLMIFLRSSWERQWMPLVYQTDASPSGYGVATSMWTREDAAAVGRILESRFRLGAGKARIHAAIAAGLSIDSVSGLIKAEPELTGELHTMVILGWTWEENPARLLKTSFKDVFQRRLLKTSFKDVF